MAPLQTALLFPLPLLQGPWLRQYVCTLHLLTVFAFLIIQINKKTETTLSIPPASTRLQIHSCHTKLHIMLEET